MIDWLRKDLQDPSVTIGSRELPIAIRRHPRARRLVMRLAPDGSEVRITMPSWGRTRDALAFVSSRREWIERQLGNLPQPAPPVPGGTLLYRGSPLVIDWNPDLPRKPQLHAGGLQLGGAEETLPGRLRRWLEGEALQLIQGDLAHYCAEAGQTVPELRLSRAQRRWGSCSGKRCIRINWRLVQAPDPVRRSVVAHEVAHLVHFDHSPAFHALLGTLFEGDLEAADRWLKREGRSLYCTFG
ncbi:hypothetical protein FHS61_001284 [Altererythrobacter atlanticus]|uniref:Uncharacterized protein n=1 Tax=Croceibacterium atlanticum TaxID=1267766 RepID=A0A0F7KYS5_9SPHN|nr:SprT family zinc-dependent metalloprotease [Croceibacterium atlanticum]AKH43970.1 hypothetical protein WYH_02944 [Croceibacterium atlanticum]MBB5732275.1 hypothetical protein [Croceibacterium atlanticum]